MNIFPRRKSRPKHPSEHKALEAECAAIDSFYRVAKEAKERQKKIDALKERMKKNSLEQKEKLWEDDPRR